MLLQESLYPLQIQDYGNGHNIFTLTVASNRPKLLKFLFATVGMSIFAPDSKGLNIFTARLPENCSEEWHSLLKEYYTTYNLWIRTKK